MLSKFFPNNAKKGDLIPMDIQHSEGESYLPWVEKYRPNCLDQLAYQSEVIGALKNIVKTGNIPHLLFYGPAGTGKTSAIIALAKEIFGVKFYKERVIELNASDERGISVIREKVKVFAQKIYKKNPDKYKQRKRRSSVCPKAKIIVLDEADLLTNDAQSALRRIIQDYSSNARFCIICNYITKIIEPLSSRCIKFRFKSIPSEVQFSKLQEICQKEGISFDKDQLQILVQKGDLRQSINSLQSLSKLTHISDNILPVSNQFCDLLFKKISECSSMKEVYEVAENVACQGYAIDEIINGLFNSVLMVTNDKIKAILLETLAKTGERLQLGASELPLVDMLATFYYVLNLSM